ncbi:MAG: Rrf2 family transcriptional regulator [Tissierellia bacterium]|nr:Rrf2 family transcriptional regulator [Tissierellia bacterium]
MRLSTRGRYGLRLMYCLARHMNDKPIPLSLISKELDLPLNYLEQLIRKLRDSNLVKSYRGAFGGYKLSKNPDEISVGEILRVLENHMAPTECAESENVCYIEQTCAARVVWKRISDGINQAVDNYTLQDMIDETNQSNIKEEV